jgi:hypothetical protein
VRGTMTRGIIRPGMIIADARVSWLRHGAVPKYSHTYLTGASGYQAGHATGSSSPHCAWWSCEAHPSGRTHGTIFDLPLLRNQPRPPFFSSTYISMLHFAIRLFLSCMLPWCMLLRCDLVVFMFKVKVGKFPRRMGEIYVWSLGRFVLSNT